MTDSFTIFNVVRMLIVAALSFFTALLIEPLWTRVLIRYFARGKQIAREGAPVFTALHKKKEGTPTMGGFIIWFTVVLLTIFFWILHGTVDGFWSRFNWLVRSETYLPLAFVFVAGLIGMADDIIGIKRRGGLGMKYRLLLYTLVAGGGAWWFVVKLGKDMINIPFLGDVHIGPWYPLFFVFVIVATAFSMNETDGLDGLSGGTSLTILAAYAVIAFDQGRMDLATLLVAFMGALIAFLWFNIYPARFFMGDTGIMAIGFTIGVVAMLTNTALLLPFIAIIPLVESASVLLQMTSKKLRGKKIFISTPIHHTFEALGWHETQITMRFWMINAIGAILGLTIFLADSKIPPLTYQVAHDLIRTIVR
jgi:phospho-N-acetylmuramoyl-pentapeptide-transferase